jgi:ATP-dependent RNA helicase RhlE
MTQNRRQDAINGFKGGKYDILVATDIAARGIDVSEISHVINYDMPDTVDAYTHRIGRTGRALQTGEAFTFASPADEIIIRQIEQALGARIERRRLPDFDYGSEIQEKAFAPERIQPPRPQTSRPRPIGGRSFTGQTAAGGRSATTSRQRNAAPSDSRPSRSAAPQQRKSLPASSSARRSW